VEQLAVEQLAVEQLAVEQLAVGEVEVAIREATGDGEMIRMGLLPPLEVPLLLILMAMGYKQLGSIKKSILIIMAMVFGKNPDSLALVMAFLCLIGMVMGR
jgi:hypothetical protein